MRPQLTLMPALALALSLVWALGAGACDKPADPAAQAPTTAPQVAALERAQAQGTLPEAWHGTYGGDQGASHRVVVTANKIQVDGIKCPFNAELTAVRCGADGTKCQWTDEGGRKGSVTSRMEDVLAFATHADERCESVALTFAGRRVPNFDVEVPVAFRGTWVHQGEPSYAISIEARRFAHTDRIGECLANSTVITQVACDEKTPDSCRFHGENAKGALSLSDGGKALELQAEVPVGMRGRSGRPCAASPYNGKFTRQ